MVDLRPFFEPRAVAVVGATGNPTKWGYFILHNLVAGGFQGPILPVNPRGGTLFGRGVVDSVDALPAGEVDLALVAVPPAAVAAAIEALGRRGVRAAYVVTGGYSETGAGGRRLEDELAAAARRAGVLLAGPNGQGILSVPARLYLQMSFARPPLGGLSMATQSGNMGATMMHLAEHTGVGFARLASVGNAASLGIEDFLAWLASDDATRVIALYVEGVRDGGAFLAGLSAAAERKPVIVLKGGRTRGGSAAALSHTGALAGRADVFGQVCAGAGATVVRSIEEMFDVASAFGSTPIPAGPRVGIVTVGGGWGVVAADAVEEAGLELPPLPAELLGKLDAILPPRWSRGNPVDFAGDLGPGAMFRCVEAVVRSGAFDVVLHLGGGLAGFVSAQVRSSPCYPSQMLDVVADEAARRDERLGGTLTELAGSPGCAMVFASDAAASPDAATNPGLGALRARGIRVYPSPERAVRAIAALAGRGIALGAKAARRPRGDPGDAAPRGVAVGGSALQPVLDALAAGHDQLAEDAASGVLAAAGVPFAAFESVVDADAAVAAAERLGCPVVVKGAGPGIAHKSEAGLVRTRLRSAAEVRSAAEEVFGRPGVARAIVARHVEGRRELLVGLVRDPSFGPLGVVGLGGTMTEALADTAFVALPASARDVETAFARLRARSIFGRFRGEEAVDREAVAAILGALWSVAIAVPGIAAIDLNPVVVSAEGSPVAVDALVTLRGSR